jgi:hypothetical protein
VFTMDDAIGVSIQRPLPRFQWLQSYDLTCPIHNEIIPDSYKLFHSMSEITHLNDVASTRQQSATSKCSLPLETADYHSVAPKNYIVRPIIQNMLGCK